MSSVDLKIEKIIISEVAVILIIWKESDTPTHAHTLLHDIPHNLTPCVLMDFI